MPFHQDTHSLPRDPAGPRKATASTSIYPARHGPRTRSSSLRLHDLYAFLAGLTP